jgi:hypothetical protein
LGFYRRLKTAVIPLGVHKSILAFVLFQWELFTTNHIIVSV